MGRAIVRDPAVFLFDEPLSNLDAKLRVQMRAEIKELHQRLGTTSVYVTHDQIEAMTMADRIVVMHGGVVEHIGRPLDLYDRPSNLFVAGFIGSPSMNLIDGTAQTAGTFTIDSGTSIPVSGLSAHQASGLVLGVRPEHIEVVAAGSEGAMAGQVVVTEPTGSETLVTLRVGKSDLLALFRSRIEVQPGDTIHVRVLPGKAHLFDKASGRRLD